VDMEKIFKFFGKEYVNINQAAILLGLFAFFSQVLGLIRDRLLAHFIGPGLDLDVYYTAFRIPDFIFISVASLASITVLIPFLAPKIQNKVVTKEAERFLNNIFIVFFSALVLISLIVFFLMPFLVPLVAPGFDALVQGKVVAISRIMLLSPILIGLSNLLGTVTQLFRKFFIYSLSPVFYNLGIIFGIVLLYPIWGLCGLASGVVLGAFLHFYIQLFSAKSCGFIPKFVFTVNFKEIKEVIFTSLKLELCKACL